MSFLPVQTHNDVTAVRKVLVRTLLCSVMTFSTWNTSAIAECLVPSPEIVFAQNMAFLGRVTEVRFLEDASQVATVEVTRIWKGNPPKRAVIFRDALNVEATFLEVGTDYLLMPSPLPQSVAESRQLPADALFEGNCSAVRVDSDVARGWIAALGPGRPPQ